MSEQGTVKVFQINSCDWHAGYDAESVLAGYCAQTNLSPEEATQGEPEYPREVSDKELSILRFVADPYEGEPEMSFREALDGMIARGVKFPAVFASTEY
jgi:hypothetical protein